MQKLTSERTDKISCFEHRELHYVLRDKRTNNHPLGTIIKGEHPICGGTCSIITLKDNKGRLVVKPHTKCDPFECLNVLSHKCSGGSSLALPKAMLDCNKTVSH